MLSKHCNKSAFCELAREDINVVMGEGNNEIKIMFVGRDPGETENREVRPFVGASGLFLRTLINKHYGRDKNVYITNLVKCHTPGNRGPTQQEIDVCSTHLIDEVLQREPLVIVTLGLEVTRFFLRPFAPNIDSIKMGTLTGKSFKVTLFSKSEHPMNVFVVPCYHPSPFNSKYYPEIERVIAGTRAYFVNESKLSIDD